MPHTRIPDTRQVVNHAHAVFCPISVIEAIQKRTGKASAPDAIPMIALRCGSTVLNLALNAGFCFKAVVSSTAGAWVLGSYKCDAETAVHAAGRDQS